MNNYGVLVKYLVMYELLVLTYMEGGLHLALKSVSTLCKVVLELHILFTNILDIQSLKSFKNI